MALFHLSALFTVPFDIQKLETKGGGIPLVEDVMLFVVSNFGTLVYRPCHPVPVD
jgi:hypothetical protein